VNYHPAFFIISAAVVGDYPSERRDRTQTLKRQLRNAGYATAPCNGCYKNRREQSILVIDENPGLANCLNDVLRLAKVYRQESVLSVDVNRAATLVYIAGKREPIGRFVSVSKETAEISDGYTERGGRYYVCKP